MNTAAHYLEKMEQSNIFMTNEMTFVEYSESLIEFQDMITKLVMGNDYEEGMRIDEAIYRLEAKARAKGIHYDHQFRKGIAALKTVSREISISLAGKKGENLVAKTLEYVTRPNTTMYRNIYVSNGKEETELDNVILTNEGIIILEIKNTKDNVIITEEGRLLHSGAESYGKQTLCEKMRIKRRLLKQKLESVIEEKGLNIPVSIESFIVFSSPKGVRVEVDDRFRKEKWCYRTGLNKKLDYYVGLTTYNNEQLEQLSSILSEIETEIKRFDLTVNFDEVRKDIADALAMFDEEQIIVVQETTTNKVAKKQSAKVVDITNEYAKRVSKRRIAGIMVGAFTSIACIGALGASVIIGRR